MPQLNKNGLYMCDIEIKLSYGVSFNIMIVQHLDALNSSAVSGIQQASTELQTQHTVELQLLVSIV